MVFYSLSLTIRQARFRPPTPGARFQNVAVMEEAVEHWGNGGAVTDVISPSLRPAGSM